MALDDYVADEERWERETLADYERLHAAGEYRKLCQDYCHEGVQAGKEGAIPTGNEVDGFFVCSLWKPTLEELAGALLELARGGQMGC